MYKFLVDSHCHLNMLQDEKNLSPVDVIAKADEKGVKIVNNICTDVDEFDSEDQNDDIFSIGKKEWS